MHDDLAATDDVRLDLTLTARPIEFSDGRSIPRYSIGYKQANMGHYFGSGTLDGPEIVNPSVQFK